jgi:hypothetical protein
VWHTLGVRVYLSPRCFCCWRLLIVMWLGRRVCITYPHDAPLELDPTRLHVWIPQSSPWWRSPTINSAEIQRRTCKQSFTDLGLMTDLCRRASRTD